MRNFRCMLVSGVYFYLFLRLPFPRIFAILNVDERMISRFFRYPFSEKEPILQQYQTVREVGMKIGKQLYKFRKARGFTQEKLAKKLGVSFQTISAWENDTHLPKIDKVGKLASTLNVKISDICEENPDDSQDWMISDHIFQVKNMFRQVKISANALHFHQTLSALSCSSKMHQNQFRKGNSDLPYIIHPLTMACHAMALGLYEDSLLATILLHDVCEDCKHEDGTPIDPGELPVSLEVQEAVSLLSKPKTMNEDTVNAYYHRISKNRLALITKVLDRCNNISTMAHCFSKPKIAKYIYSTEKYVLPLLEIMKNQYSETCYNAVFLIKYQMATTIETIKRLL